MKIGVYTYVLGSYDKLLDQPVAADSDADFICLTDDPGLRSDTWKTLLVEPRYPADLVRSARALKILGDERLSEYDVLVSMDASVMLLSTPEKIVEDWLDDEHDLALSEHSYRENVLDEFDEVVRLNYDDRARVHEQLLAYAEFLPASLETTPLWTGLMVRRNNAAVAETMRLWLDHVLRYSRRDQLSINAVLERTGLAVARLHLDNFGSEYHRWPAIEGRRISLGKASPYGTGPLLSEVRRARRQLDELEAQLGEVRGLIATAGVTDIQQLGSEFARLTSDIAAVEGERARERAELSAQAAQWRERWHRTQGVRAASANLLRAVRNAVGRRLRR